MQRFFLSFFLFTSSFLSAQSLSNLSFGTDSTFEVATWNIEWFPKNGQASVSAVGEIIGALDIDVWALQEIDDSSMLKQSIASLADYKAVFGGSDSRGLTYVYNTKTISNVKTFRLFDESIYSSPLPRAPFVLEFTYQDSLIRIVDNHYKCCGNGKWDKSNSNDEENRRYLGHRLIMDYIDSVWTNQNVMLVGDLNDILTDDRENNIFQNELTNSRQYRFVDLPVEESNNANWSYPSWPSHLDHILVCGPLLKQYDKPNTKVECIKVDEQLTGKWSEYDRDISDHRPVAYKFDFIQKKEVKDSNETSVPNAIVEKFDLNVFPNPSKGQLTIKIENSFNASKLKIIDMSGRPIYSEDIEPQKMKIQKMLEIHQSGRYFIQLLESETILYSQPLIISK